MKLQIIISTRILKDRTAISLEIFNLSPQGPSVEHNLGLQYENVCTVICDKNTGIKQNTGCDVMKG